MVVDIALSILLAVAILFIGLPLLMQLLAGIITWIGDLMVGDNDVLSKQ